MLVTVGLAMKPSFCLLFLSKFALEHIYVALISGSGYYMHERIVCFGESKSNFIKYKLYWTSQSQRHSLQNDSVGT